MKNIIFISPNFPTNYWRFCKELKQNGMNVLGIGDQPYDELPEVLKDSLNEYYRVSDLEHEDEVYRAVAFFIFKHGRIDWLESNNEYWLERDAKLRTDFNIRSGFQVSDMPSIKCKSRMKAFYTKAGIPVARYALPETLEDALRFTAEVGYPIIAKPDNGVGASHTCRLESDAQVQAFFEEKEPGTIYILEEFIDAQVNSYDAIIDSNGEPIFETGNVTVDSIMDVVNEQGDSIYYIVKDLAEDVRAAGRATVKSFGVKSRFVHFEFFRLLSDQHIGKKGDVVALEVNMRPCGGFSPDMMNFANSTDVYKIWADMIAFDRSTVALGTRAFCAFAGRRDGKHYAMDHEAIMAAYGQHMKMVERIPDALSDAMGNQMYVALFDSIEELNSFYSEILKPAT